MVKKYATLKATQIIKSPFRTDEGTEQARIDMDKFAANIRQIGVQSPLVVSPIGKGMYLLHAGHRRFEAAQRIGIKSFCCFITDNEDGCQFTLAENLLRQELSPIDTAKGMKVIQRDKKRSMAEISAILGVPASTLKSYSYIFNLIPELQKIIKYKKISPSAIRMLFGLNACGQRQIYLHLADMQGRIVPHTLTPLLIQMRPQYFTGNKNPYLSFTPRISVSKSASSTLNARRKKMQEESRSSVDIRSNLHLYFTFFKKCLGIKEIERFLKKTYRKEISEIQDLAKINGVSLQ
jgi:ParB/RepB/Spo0J family partition protein